MTDSDPFASDSSGMPDPSDFHKCLDPDRCEWGSQCNGNHSYSHCRSMHHLPLYTGKKGNVVVDQPPPLSAVVDRVTVHQVVVDSEDEATETSDDLSNDDEIGKGLPLILIAPNSMDDSSSS